MSLTEIKHAVDGLQPDERLELAEYVRWRATQDDPEWQAEMAHKKRALEILDCLDAALTKVK